MIFISVKQLAQDIMSLVPFCHEKNIGGIVGVPRSGLLPATLLADHLHIPLILPDGVAHGNRYTAHHTRGIEGGSILVLDDTAGTGKSLYRMADQVRERFPDHSVHQGAMYITPGLEDSLCVYCRAITEWPRLFEWNFLNNAWTDQCMFDIDGVLCVDPPPERDEAAYVEYIANAIPKYVPTFAVGWICTNRLHTRRAVTEEWFRRYKIDVKHAIVMQPYETAEERRKESPPAEFKGAAYRAASQHGCILFIESHDRIAEEIAARSRKPVLSIESMTLF